MSSIPLVHAPVFHFATVLAALEGAPRNLFNTKNSATSLILAPIAAIDSSSAYFLLHCPDRNMFCRVFYVFLFAPNQSE